MNNNISSIIEERARTELERRFPGWRVSVQVRVEAEAHYHLHADGVSIIDMAQWLAVVAIATPDGYVGVGAEVDALTGAQVWFVPESEVVGDAA